MNHITILMIFLWCLPEYFTRNTSNTAIFNCTSIQFTNKLVQREAHHCIQLPFRSSLDQQPHILTTDQNILEGSGHMKSK